MGRGEEVGSARKGAGESKGSREMEYEGMQPMPPSEVGRAKRRGLVRDSRMKSPEGWPIAARMMGIRSQDRKSIEAQEGGKEEKDFAAHRVGPQWSCGRRRLRFASRSDRALSDGGRGGRDDEIDIQSREGEVVVFGGGEREVAGCEGRGRCVVCGVSVWKAGWRVEGRRVRG